MLASLCQVSQPHFMEHFGKYSIARADQQQVQTLRHNHEHLKDSFENKIMSKEELKIWDELEMEIETALEEEIKDGICRLALRLHGLHLHKRAKTRYTRESSNEKIIELKITVKMEGDCQIEINEIKKDEPKKAKAPIKSDFKLAGVFCRSKQIDWASSLRSGKHAIAAVDQISKKKRCGLDQHNLA